MNQINDFINSLKGTILDCKQTVIDVADSSKDLVFDETTLENIPIVKYGVSVLNIRDSYHQRRFLNNVKGFLDGIGKTDHEEIEDQAKRILEEDPETFFDTVVGILIDSTKPIKAQIVGGIFSSLAEGLIERNEFENLSQVVMSASAISLKTFGFYMEYKHGTDDHPDENEEALIASSGLGMRYGTMFDANIMGKRLFEFGFQKGNWSE